MKTLYVTDLDGTLLNTKDSINEYSLRVINELEAKGMQFTYATARSLSSASIVTRGLQTSLPVIVYNGCIIIDPVTRKVFSSINFNDEETTYLKQAVYDNHLQALVYSFVDGVEKISWIAKGENEGMLHYLNNRKGDKRLRPLQDGTDLFAGNVFYVTCIGEKEELAPLYQEVAEDSRFTSILQQELYRQEYWLEIMPKKATKAHAIENLKELMHCDRIVSFGDAINDVPMFQISDECYAVANAVEPLKAVATDTIGSNEEDGVARFLEDRFA